MPIMSAPNAGALANKKRITGPTLRGTVYYDFTNQYIYDNDVQWDMSQWVSGSTITAGTRVWSVYSATTYEGPNPGVEHLYSPPAAPEPVSFSGDTISCSTIGYSYNGANYGGGAYDAYLPGIGTRDVVINGYYTGTHDFESFAIPGGYTNLRVVHSANVDVKNSGNCVQDYNGSIIQFNCPWPFDPDKNNFCASLLDGV